MKDDLFIAKGETPVDLGSVYARLEGINRVIRQIRNGKEAEVEDLIAGRGRKELVK